MPWILAFALLLAASAVSADDGIEFFEKKVRPVLAEKCYGCHSAKVKVPMGGLRLDSMASMLRGGNSEPALKLGDIASLVLRAVSYKNAQLKMPPAGKLENEQIADLTRWVEMGAPAPKDAPPVASAPFWAFGPLAKVEPPQGTAASPVDRFLQAKLAEKGLRQALPADRRSWLRRLTVDLTRMPPAPGELAEFLADNSPQAYGKVVESCQPETPRVP